MIFISESLEDLNNTKQFSKFTDKEYKIWKSKRDRLSHIPLLPSEPIAFFDIDDQNEIIINVENSRPCRYIKFIPTAFRKKPINFSSKALINN